MQRRATIVQRLGKSLAYRSYGNKPAQSFRDLVSYVSGVDIRENKHVRASGYIAARSLYGRDLRHERRVELEFAVQFEIRRHFFGKLRGLLHFSNGVRELGVVARSLRRERKLATLGSMPAIVLAVFAEVTAISASCSAVGQILRAQSANTNTPSLQY